MEAFREDLRKKNVRRSLLNNVRVYAYNRDRGLAHQFQLLKILLQTKQEASSSYSKNQEFHPIMPRPRSRAKLSFSGDAICRVCACKDQTFFSRNQLSVYGSSGQARCKTCVESAANVVPTVAKSVDRLQTAQSKTDCCSCEICGIRFQLNSKQAHENGKTHQRNLQLSKSPGYISVAASGLADGQLRAVGKGKSDNWLSPAQLAAAATLIKLSDPDSQITSALFAAACLRGHFRNTRGLGIEQCWCSPEERDAALSLRPIASCGVSAAYFSPTIRDMIKHDGGATKVYVSPAEIEDAKCHRSASTIRVADSGLDHWRSRFDFIGVEGDFCTPEELEEAKSLEDARESNIPLHYFEDYDSDSDDDYDDDSDDDGDRDRERKPPQPLWATPDEVQRASDQYDGAGILAEWDRPWDFY